MSTPRKKAVYALRIRGDESQAWGSAEYYRTRKARDFDERMNRIIGGLRTHSFTEKKTAAEIDAICQ